MVTCSRCGREFLCDRAALMSKKPFARACKVVEVKSRNGRRIFNAALMETGVVQAICFCSALLIGVGCLWSFYDASMNEGGTSFLSMLLQPQQQAFAWFFACLAGVLMMFAGRRRKVFFIMLGLLLAGGIASLPYAYPVIVNPSLQGDAGVNRPQGKSNDVTGFTEIDGDVVEGQIEVANHYGERDLKPLFAAIDRKESVGVLGVWTVGVNEANRDMVKSYLKRMTQSEDEPMFYNRKGTGGGLFVVTPTPITFNEFVDVVSKMGEVRLQDKDKFFVEVELNRDKFEARPASAALQDERHQYFVLANLKELSSLDVRRVIAAARRLTAVEPDKLREDVVAKLKDLLKEPWGRDSEYVSAVVSALAVWAETSDDDAQRVAYYVAEEMKKADCEIPPSVLRFLLKGKEQGAAGMLLSVWKADPRKWEEECKALGPTGETAVLKVLNESDDFVLKRSAARILGEIGAEPSLVALKGFVRDADNELRLSAELSVNLIEKRLGRGAATMQAP